MSELREAAQAVCDRWESPDWKDGVHTGELIKRLRKAIEQDTQESDWTYSAIKQLANVIDDIKPYSYEKAACCDYLKSNAKDIAHAISQSKQNQRESDMSACDEAYKSLLEQRETLEKENAELKASVNALRYALQAMVSAADEHRCGLRIADDALSQTPPQSLAEHDRQVRNDALEEAIKACLDTDVVEANDYDAQLGDVAATRTAIALAIVALKQ